MTGDPPRRHAWRLVPALVGLSLLLLALCARPALRTLAPAFAVDVAAREADPGLVGTGGSLATNWFVLSKGPDPWGSSWVVHPGLIESGQDDAEEVDPTRIWDRSVDPGQDALGAIPAVYSIGPNLLNEQGAGDDLVVGDRDRFTVYAWSWITRVLPWLGGLLLWIALCPLRAPPASPPKEALYVALLTSLPAIGVWKLVLWGRLAYPAWELPLVEDTMLVSSHVAVGVTAFGLLVLATTRLRIWSGARAEGARESAQPELEPPPEAAS
tara:strand:- start:240 stop:1046 length:807 start_codon:yes stop_codon:yes gene_type:complete